jgi:hypothetical protein
MMAPLIVGIVAAVATLVAITVLIISYQKIIEWFRNRQNLKEQDKANIAFTLTEHLANGDYEVVHGIFNKDTSELLDGEKQRSHNIDAELAKAHEKHELVLYE